nr:MAG TPA: hypothetical protein [Caudoviricetes sp.]DAZ08404.1 MAG TPA: hypothetical protein [Caudoviricetes sp.]
MGIKKSLAALRSLLFNLIIAIFWELYNSNI